MLVLVIGRPDLKTAGISDCFFEDCNKIFYKCRAGIINFHPFFCAFNLSCAITLDCKSNSPATWMIRGKAVHVEHRQVYPCRSFYRYLPVKWFEQVLLLFIPKGLEVLSR